jgi:hypothetical protein
MLGVHLGARFGNQFRLVMSLFWRSGAFLIVPRAFIMPRGMVHAHEPEN